MSTEYSERETLTARALRVAVIKNLVESNNITREDALEVLNGPLNPQDPDHNVFDDRDKLDITDEEFNLWVHSQDGEGV